MLAYAQLLHPFLEFVSECIALAIQDFEREQNYITDLLAHPSLSDKERLLLKVRWVECEDGIQKLTKLQRFIKKLASKLK